MLVKAAQYQDMPMRAPTQKGIRIISEMKSSSILWYLAKKHKVGILATLAIVGFTYDTLIPFAARELFYTLFR